MCGRDLLVASPVMHCCSCQNMCCCDCYCCCCVYFGRTLSLDAVGSFVAGYIVDAVLMGGKEKNEYENIYGVCVRKGAGKRGVWAGCTAGVRVSVMWCVCVIVCMWFRVTTTMCVVKRVSALNSRFIIPRNEKCIWMRGIWLKKASSADLCFTTCSMSARTPIACTSEPHHTNGRMVWNKIANYNYMFVLITFGTCAFKINISNFGNWQPYVLSKNHNIQIQTKKFMRTPDAHRTCL